MIKYLGSKRRLVPVLSAIATAAGARRSLDLFSGTARVGLALKQAGSFVTAVDAAYYAHILAETYVATDAASLDSEELAASLAELAALPGKRGYVTEIFCERSRYFHPDNGQRIDAIREAIEDRHAGSPIYPLLLTSLLEAADRVDSTTGVQMAYLKSWAPRALRPLELRPPQIVRGPGRAVLGDAVALAGALGHFDLAYLDPPYNQHRYLANYHVWETLCRWDAPESYGVACKRVDLRDETTSSPFNRKREMPAALARVMAEVECDLLLVSYNDEAWVTLDELVSMCRPHASRLHAPSLVVLGFEQARYVGARIGIHNPSGEKVGRVSHLRNTEFLVASGEREITEAVVKAGLGASETGTLVRSAGAGGSFLTKARSASR